MEKYRTISKKAEQQLLEIQKLLYKELKLNNINYDKNNSLVFSNNKQKKDNIFRE